MIYQHFSMLNKNEMIYFYTLCLLLENALNQYMAGYIYVSILYC